MSAIHNETFSKFEELGEPEVRKRLECNDFNIMHQGPARAWLSLKESEAQKRAEMREEENLSTSRKALRNSERATNIAIVAILLSISMTILEFIKWYSSK